MLESIDYSPIRVDNIILPDIEIPKQPREITVVYNDSSHNDSFITSQSSLSKSSSKSLASFNVELEISIPSYR